MIYPPRCDKPLKADRKVKPTEPTWAVKYETCVHVGEAKSERVRESVNPLDGRTRPFGFCGGRRTATDPSCTERFFIFFQRDADVEETVGGDALARGVQNEKTPAGRPCACSFSHACCHDVCVLCEPCVRVGCRLCSGGEDTGCYWSYRDFWPTPVGPPSRYALAACARLWAEAARRRSGPWWVKSNNKKKRIFFFFAEMKADKNMETMASERWMRN